MTTPTDITSLTAAAKLADPALWYTAGQEIKLGCTTCPELRWCGGLSIQAPVFTCMDLCGGDCERCHRYACPNQPRYSALVNEVGGLDLRPYQRWISPMSKLPHYVPCVLDSGTIRGPLPCPVVAISLFAVIDSRTGLSKFKCRRELLERFKINQRARVVLVSIGKDRHVEEFWHALKPKKTAESLKALRPALITTPNFSMHADAVRHDNLISMARIAACFEEFAALGLPVALHVNSRAPHDFSRWTDYLNASPGIYAIAYEMGTIGRSARRRLWHSQQLIALAHQVERPLTLVIRAGWRHLPELADAFDRVVILDTSAHMKAKMRQRAVCNGARLEWIRSPTPAGETIDELLLNNIRASRRACGMLVRSCSASRIEVDDPGRASMEKMNLVSQSRRGVQYAPTLFSGQ